MHFVYSMAWEGFCQHKLRYILCPPGIGDFGQHILRWN